MLTTTQALVLRTVKFGDQQVIVDMLTSELGRLSVLCRIPKTSKARIKKQFFQPLSLLEVEVDYRQRSRLQRLRDARLAAAYQSVPFDAAKLSTALFVAEFLLYVTRDEQPNPALFSYVASSLQWLDGQTRPAANFHLVFMMRLSRFVGFFPNLDSYEQGCVFDLRDGTFLPHPPLHPDYLSVSDSARVRMLMRMNFDNMHLFRMSRQERNQCTETILAYYRLHVPAFPELRSLGVVQELFA